MNSTIKTERFKALNEETGEIQDLIRLGQDYMLVSKKSSSAFKEKQLLEDRNQQRRSRNWVACYHDPIKNKTKLLTLTECGAIMKLIPYLQFGGEGILTRNNEAMKLKDIQEILGKSKPATIKILDRLEEQGILYKKKQGRSNLYIISGEIHTIGEVLQGTLFTKLYQGRTKELLEKINLHEAGILYKILPFFHYRNYHLCLNPNEDNEEMIHYLSRTELAELIDHDEKTLYRNMMALCSHGVLIRKTASKRTLYVIHPDLMFRQEFEDSEAEFVRREFERHNRASSLPSLR